MKVARLIILLLFPICFADCQSLRFSFADSALLPLKPTGELHGISAIEYVAANQQWHLASDRGAYFIFDSITGIRDFKVRLPLAKKRHTGLWYEALRYDPVSGNFLYAVENEYKPGEETNDTTTYVAYYEPFPPLQVNPVYLIPPLPLPADNKGIESLAVTDSGNVWVAPEAGWAGETEVGQDTIHFRKFIRNSSGYSAPQLFSYVIDRSGCPNSDKEKRGGISEIVAAGENKLLVLERCFDNGPGGTNRIKAKLWEVNAAQQHLKKEPKPAFDFKNLPFAPDNLEGMCWWPTAGGKRKLLLITDDNPGLDNKQRTQLILLQEN
ncbi:esterase-like activity of phytase family protein [Dyadobacter sandarakinus]|uniref:Esterase-like activity of phytase family protein n=1 Tax=Dyadobacter sandarakinus TaxID=2747268 RepID=A0ABX7I4X9_9BACT|nr:esterase-like activity of phytase family protein [Dyadobacter sandarakinus]QRR00914.1 esterase-like activity of phytase family protein [Dyadobacter sandarakinus]